MSIFKTKLVKSQGFLHRSLRMKRKAMRTALFGAIKIIGTVISMLDDPPKSPLLANRRLVLVSKNGRSLDVNIAKKNSNRGVVDPIRGDQGD
jgi:hypothetical protein